MVTKATKEKTVAELKEKFARATAVYTTDQKGLTVSEISQLRNDIRSLNAEYKLAKNTLIRVAARDTEFESLTGELSGTTAILFCYGDNISPASKLKKFSSSTQDKVSFKGAFLDGSTLDAVSALKIADLPPKEVILAQIAGMLVQPAVSIAYILKELGEKADKGKLLKEFILPEVEGDKE
jgi:large subunit ribosomal protein L10